MPEALTKILEQFKSRKVISIVMGILYTLLTYFKDEIGLAIDPTAMLMGVAVLALYIFGEAKSDLKKAKTSGKWTDPKFWLSMIGAALPIATTVVGVGAKLPVKEVTGIIGTVVGFLFKKKKK